ncbi:Uncharacterised protein [Mycobacteroides abscessus subsp. abscessus]|nr:Uncharacterised protein [Mycobacteroides abscessus subsp. abscessus]
MDTRGGGVGVFVVGFPGSGVVEAHGVGMPAAGQTDVGDRAGRGLGRQQGVAGVGGDALGGVHGHRVPQMGVLAQVIARQDRDRAVVETPRRDPPHIGVDGEDLPALSVANRIGVGTTVGAGGDVGGVLSGDHHVADRDAVTARGGHGGRIVADSLGVDADVDRIGHLPPIGDQQTVTAGDDVRPPGRHGVIGHGDLIPAVQPLVTAVPAHRAAQRRRPTVADRQRDVALVVIVHPPHLRQALRPRQIGDQLGEGAAALRDRRQLVLITNQHDLGAGAGGHLQQPAQVLSADHACLVDDDHGVDVEDLGAALEAAQHRVQGGPVVAGLLAHRHVDRTPGRSGHQNAFPGIVRRSAQRSQGVGFPGPCRGAERLYEPLRGRDGGDGAGLIRRQSSGVHRRQHRGAVAAAHQLDDGAFFGDQIGGGVADRPLPLMRLPFVSDAQCDTIGEALDHLPRRRSIGVVDRQPGADRLDEIRTCERRLRKAVRHRATHHLRVVHTGSPTRFSRSLLDGLVDPKCAVVIGPCDTQRRPCDTFGFPWPGGLLRGRQLPRGQLVIAAEAQMPRRPLAQLRGPRRPRPQLGAVHSGDVGHPGVRIDVVPLHADRTCQLPPQRGLVDDPGGLRFVIETRPVQRHQPPIRTRLTVRDQHVGVQMRVPGPRGFVLKTGRHDPR